MNVRESRVYRVITEWWCRERGKRLAFRRTHYRDARGIESAKRKQRKHNRARARDGMRAEGWRWRIVAARFWVSL